MGTVANVLLCSFLVGVAQSKVTLEPDRAFLRVHVLHKAELECCYSTDEKSVKFTWVKRTANNNLPPQLVQLSNHVTKGETQVLGKSCGNLTFNEVRLNDSGLYLCLLNGSHVDFLSHGTFLQVYKMMEKTINISETTKNTILTVEGFLLLLFVLLPSFLVLFKSKRLNELEKRKMKMEEENIYQGLNLDDCCSTYDQIERSQAHGPYQDVCNIREEEEEMELEKP
ncbi:B-cell antigen receptor complex-associated protein alpha chain [Cottoperca gobio]|uniref:B-cell antigen receptor complex-associated protein alpha chain n=1 Tax=Cottoperca gobio TaxID=56716 RepID=A0A6J2RBD4_COTGO|nr:B-cell antigen receptor complex-associated protein alpha chain [Cottoperca gobio]